MSQHTSEEQKNVSPGLQEEEPSSFRLIFTLGIAGLLAGAILVGAYLVTLPMIEANRAKALREAIYKVLPDCTSFKTLELQADELVEIIEGEETEKKAKKGEAPKRIFAGYSDSGAMVGFAIHASEPGFQDLIGGIFGYKAGEKVIVGFEVLESKETPGLGDKIMKDENFRNNFTALAVEPEIVSVKNGAKQEPNEVEAITGATISSKAVVRLLQKGISEWRPFIEKYIEANNIQ